MGINRMQPLCRSCDSQRLYQRWIETTAIEQALLRGMYCRQKVYVTVMVAGCLTGLVWASVQ
jgi:hypothetical protein